MADTAATLEKDLYQYQTLHGSNEIRCLVLAAGRANDPLFCVLKHHNLNDDPSFKAISYVWGDHVKDRTITCSGQRLDITSNLYKSLQQIRHADRERILWADSICINQGDKKEKGHQVGLMARIYTQAERVLITLGADDVSLAHSEGAAALLRQVNGMVEKTFDKISGTRDSYPYDQAVQPLVSDPRWKLIAHLARHPWFQRGWVVQEAGLAREAWILWDGESLNWVQLLQTISWVLFRAGGIQQQYDIHLLADIHLALYANRYPDEMMVWSHIKLNPSNDVLRFLHYARGLHLSDRRDHVYAFMGLPGAADLRQDLDISYEKSWSEIYYDVAHRYVTAKKDMRFLRYIEIDQETLALDVPSWVPQWHVDRYDMKLDFKETEFIKSRTQPSLEPQIIDGRTLRVRGMLIDTIDFASATLKRNSSIQEMATLWNSWVECGKSSVYKLFSPRLAFVRALTASHISPDTVMNTDAVILDLGAFLLSLFGQEYAQNEPKLRFHQDRLEHGDDQKVIRVMASSIFNRKFVVTKRGYFGLVPGVAVQGDLCSIVFGTKTPFILRKTNLSGHYKLLGLSYFVSASETAEDDPVPNRLGSGFWPHEDWWEWDVDEQDILLC
ncbi:hypothetical protein Daus18300_005611 [Diaporthe australafricana]|uniref:Heterokaryon incompatibility domain-containing protein n=1 Tax=Diaporthe australafricana TaxID=127596 RepID=A0ABR3X0R6_9PEZI